MPSFTINTGVTDTVAKTVANNDIGTIQAGGTLSDGTDITWNGGSAGQTTVIDNSGTITASTRSIDTGTGFSTGNFTLNNNSGALLTAANDAFRINLNAASGAAFNGTVAVSNSGTIRSTTNGQALDFAAVTSPNATVTIDNTATGIIRAQGDDAIRPGAGHIVISNSGLIESTSASGNIRAINVNAANLTNVSSFQLTNNAGGAIQSAGDAVRISAATLAATATGTFVVDNAGTIKTSGTGANNGQAIDFNDLVSTNGIVTITNRATGVIQAADADAVRPGTNATINNYGQIVSLNGTPTSTGNDGVDFQNSTGGIVNNFAGGVIDGARHGITGNNPNTVTNDGTIIGRVGSGINMDTAGTTTTTVNNTGTITGTSVEGVQSGDAIDVDGLAIINNSGLIDAIGTRTGGLSEGVTIGGGTVNNYAGGTIHSSQRAITFDGGGNLDGTTNSAFASSTVYNEGTIQGDNGEAIVIVGGFADTITNKGTITGSISTDGGDDIVNIYTGSSISGLSDGGAGSDTISLSGTGSGILSSLINFEVLNVQAGSWTITDSDSFTNGTTIAAAATLQLGNGGNAGSLAGNVADGGTLAFDRSDTYTYSGSVSGDGIVSLIGSGTIRLDGHSSYTGGTMIASGVLDVVTADGAGTGAIALDSGTQTIRIELTALTAGHFFNTISGFASVDTIDLADIGLATGATLGLNNVLTVTGGTGGPITLQLDPTQNFAGQVFKVVSDGAGGTDVIVAPDQAPVAQDGAASADEDHAISGTAVAIDPDGLPAPLSYSQVIGPQHGQLDFHADGSYTYTPDQDFNGSDSFTFKANDGILDSNVGTVSLTITPVNDTPVLMSSVNYSIIENQTGVGTVTAVDPEHDALLFSLAGGSDQAFFNVDVHTGLLTFVAAPDFETPEDATHDNVYDVVISATDTFGAHSEKTIHVSVTNVVEAGQVINGRNGNDVLNGSTGNDTISGGNGNDALNGGDGNDNLSGGNGDDVLTGGRGSDLLDGGNGDDRITAGNGHNTISGGNGDDTISAGNGNNTVAGGNGDDRFVLGNGNNSITGGNGDDRIAVGSGNNTMSGGNGDDMFVFGPNFGKDFITDFHPGSDRITFEGGIFHTFADVQAASHAVGSSTMISLDADHSIMLQNVSLCSLHASDFILI